ncbi:Rho GTPase-activating protein syde2 [Cichlidogyrus casuarinus]|uniref:Rho GTPase-activating protein syde2 n=1 Tax=Cichlidogyrus casuarinus TaxID=1844966 RepID=A0ABD2Q9U4_9PLAT
MSFVQIDRRGLSICGIYRICGALKLKMQLRNMFEMAFYPPEAREEEEHESLMYGHSRAHKPNRVHVNLGPEKVPDIHVITCQFSLSLSDIFLAAVLKDFLRELPEPLVTDYLYQMLLDAIKVTSNKQMGPKLIFSILDCMPPENQGLIVAMIGTITNRETAAKN